MADCPVCGRFGHFSTPVPVERRGDLCIEWATCEGCRVCWPDGVNIWVEELSFSAQWVGLAQQGCHPILPGGLRKTINRLEEGSPVGDIEYSLRKAIRAVVRRLFRHHPPDATR